MTNPQLHQAIAEQLNDLTALEDELYDTRRKFMAAVLADDSRTADDCFDLIEGNCEEYIDTLRLFHANLEKLPTADRADFSKQC